MRFGLIGLLVMVVVTSGIDSARGQTDDAQLIPPPAEAGDPPATADLLAPEEDSTPSPEDMLTDTSESPAELIERLRRMTLTDLLREARRLMDEEQIREAVPYVSVARERDPENLELAVMLGELALLEGNIEMAREKLLLAYQANRNDFRASMGLGKLYLATRRYRQAVNYLTKAEQVAPLEKVALAQQLLAEAYLGSGRLIKAREVAEQAVSGNPEAYDAYRILAAVLITVRDLDQALVQIQKLESIAQQDVAANPGDFQSLQRLGDAWRIHQQALRERLGELVVVGPDGVATDEVLPGKSDEAAEITRRMVELMLLQSEAQRIARLFEIVEISAQTLEYAPESPQHWRDHGLLLMEIQRYGEAREAFQKVLELDPGDAVAQQQLSAINAMQGVPSDDAPAESSPGETSQSSLTP